jgi:hypothetical protein
MEEDKWILMEGRGVVKRPGLARQLGRESGKRTFPFGVMLR